MAQKLEERPVAAADIATLESIERRILWLATNIVNYANHVRPNPDGSKVGGHQASSASVVSILTALYFHFLRAGDRVAIKPHASPAYHALQYLLGNLPQSYLTELRAFGGLQAYPSRTKDPDPIDFSTGSVGLGAAAPAFAALTADYARAQFGSVTSDRFIALLGDAELDEGNVWECVNEEALRGLSNVLWIVDLNRQSLDRIVPGIRAAQLKALFLESGWHVLEAKYGRRLEAIFAKPDGETLRQRIDDMPNEEYQSLLRFDGATLRPRIANGDPALEQLLADISDDDLPDVYANLGGHDLDVLIETFQKADSYSDGPTVIFAYTVKGWGLPIAGDRLNHSALLTPEQLVTVREKLGLTDATQWDRFAPGTPEGNLCARAAERLRRPADAGVPPLPAASIPPTLNLSAVGQTSTQDAFGRVLRRLADMPEVGKRIVTTSPDVSISTNLAGWINKTGVYAPTHHPNFAGDAPTTLKWQPSPTGQHIELGISEMNLFMLLGALGLSYEQSGQHLLPIGTVYDPFICRGLDALIYALYTGAKMIFAGTPSGITLSPEGGAHQSTVTPSLGMELPHLLSYEPGFGQEVEWILLEALRQCCDRQAGASTYMRLSTKTVDQSLLQPALDHYGADELRRQTLAGGYRLVDRTHAAPHIAARYAVNIAVSGTQIPEAVAAARLLHKEGVAANVLNLTSPQRLFATWQAGRRNHLHGRSAEMELGQLATLILPDERHAPIITVHDAASHALAWLGSVFGAPTIALGVDDFGQSGSRADLYHHYGLDAEHIAEAAFTALDTTT